MAQKLSHHYSKIIQYCIMWFIVFFAVFGSVKSCFNHVNCEDYTNTNRFISKQFVRDLDREIRSIKSDSKMKIINMLASRNRSEIPIMSNIYNDHYQRELVLDIKNKFFGKLEQIAVALVTPELEYTVRLIHDAMIGVETDWCALIDILGTQNNAELREIQDEYYIRYGTRLRSDLDKYTFGNLKKLLNALITWSRSKRSDGTKAQANQDVKNLNTALKMFQNDTILMNNILVVGSFDRIQKAVYCYFRVCKQYFESKISEMFDGDVKRALITIVRWSKGKNKFFAERLHSGLTSHDTENNCFIRTIVSNIDNMEPIKEEYQKRYKMSLEDSIRKNSGNGDYAKALITLIEEKKYTEDKSDESYESTTEMNRFNVLNLLQRTHISDWI